MESCNRFMPDSGYKGYEKDIFCDLPIGFECKWDRVRHMESRQRREWIPSEGEIHAVA